MSQMINEIDEQTISNTDESFVQFVTTVMELGGKKVRYDIVRDGTIATSFMVDGVLVTIKHHNGCFAGYELGNFELPLNLRALPSVGQLSDLIGAYKTIRKYTLPPVTAI